MISTRRTVSIALKTTAIAAALVLLSADPASACHKKRKARCNTATPVAYGCSSAPVSYGSYGGGYHSTPMPSHQGAYGMASGQGAYGVTSSPYAAMPAPTGYGVGQGMAGQVMSAPGRIMRGVGQALPGGFGRGGMGYGAPGAGYGAPGAYGGGVGYGAPGVYGPGQMGGYGPGMGGGVQGGWGY
ncbi:hypothetical protein AB1L88_02235 [Tautonia sp. JC769]|uniref:hypothetical protein n=1 Tax=Tautonia sp. JC769 TaxID=3232135 RepID=UPI0034584946